MTQFYLFFVFLWIFGDNGLHACDRGLTQLRYRQSLELMYCLPGGYGIPDPCQILAGGSNVKCQPMENGYFVCCGTPEFLFELLTGAPPMLDHWHKIHHEMGKLTQLFKKIEAEKETLTAPPFFAADDDAYDDIEYDELPMTMPPMKLIKPNNYAEKSYAAKLSTRPSTTSATRPPTIFATRPTTLSSSSRASKIFNPDPSHSVIVVAKSKHKSIFTKPQNSPIITVNGPVLSLLASGHFLPEFGKTVSYSAPSTVVHLQDGPCSIIINTGLPSQQSELRAALQQKSITDTTFNYTVITSAQPQFVGNLALFPSHSLIMGAWTVDGNKISDNTVQHHRETILCSSNTLLVSTPGPTADSVTVVAKNVPGMGTVIIAGSLFIQDDNIHRVDALFTTHVAELYESRQMLICQADWIVPAHSMPIPINQKLKQSAACE